MNMSRNAFAALVAVALATPAYAQHAGHDMSSMPGMTMPMPAAKPAPNHAQPKVVHKPKRAASTPAKRPSVRVSAAKPAGMDMAGMDMRGMDLSSMPGTAHTARPAMKLRASPHKKKNTEKPSARPSTHQAAHHMHDMDMSSMPGMDMSGTSAGGQTQPAPASETMAGMNMSGMDHRSMDMSGMQHGRGDLPADLAPRTPIPALTDADRAAAMPPAGGHPAHDTTARSFWLIDRLEERNSDTSGAWDATAWIGGDVDRLWLRTEGEARRGTVETGSLDVLYGHAVSPWFDLVGGIREDFGAGPSRTYAAFGLQGLAPYKFEVRATGYLGAAGRTAVRLESQYDTLLTNRLILQWRGEANLYGRSDAARGLGSGLSTIDAGARLRFEFTRRFAPYIGVEVERAFSGTGNVRRDSGLDVTDTRLVAGLRLWF